jgi:hypothetical protein
MAGRQQWAHRDDWMTTVMGAGRPGPAPTVATDEHMPGTRLSRNTDEPAPRGRSFKRRLVLVVAGGVALCGWALAVSEPVLAQASVATAKEQYNAADAAVTAARGRVNQLFQARRDLDLEGNRLSLEQREIAKKLEDARSTAQQFMVSTYIAGTGSEVEEAIIYQESTTDVAYKSYFLKDRSQRVADAVEEHRSAFTEVDQRIADYAIRRSDTASALDQANADLDRALQDLRAADAKLREAEAAARAAAPPPPPLGAPPSGGGGSGGNASSAGWAKLRQCESSGRYNATNGIYRGAYQFDQRTWNGVGGTGDPALATPDEQDYRAQILFNQRGAQPWPVCGRSLINDPGARVEAVPP